MWVVCSIVTRNVYTEFNRIKVRAIDPCSVCIPYTGDIASLHNSCPQNIPWCVGYPWQCTVRAYRQHFIVRLRCMFFSLGGYSKVASCINFGEAHTMMDLLGDFTSTDNTIVEYCGGLSTMRLGIIPVSQETHCPVSLRRKTISMKSGCSSATTQGSMLRKQ